MFAFLEKTELQMILLNLSVMYFRNLPHRLLVCFDTLVFLGETELKINTGAGVVAQ